MPAVGASASASAEATTAPDITAQSDLLPGVNLITEEVEPGVFKMVGDGQRDLREDVRRVAVTSAGHVFVEMPGDGGRVVRLGEPGISLQGHGLHTLEDGSIWAYDSQSRPSFNATGHVLGADGWQPAKTVGGGFPLAYPVCMKAPDGACWGIVGRDGEWPGWGVLRVTPDGEERFWSLDDVASGPPNGRPDVAIAPDGTVWFVPNGGLAWYDGQAWSSLPDVPNPEMRILDLEVDGEGTVWLTQLAGGDGGEIDSIMLSRFDGTSWSTHGPLDGRVDLMDSYRLGADPDGRLWVGPFDWFDGESLRRVTQPDGWQGRLLQAAHAPDGSIWVAVDGHGLYVITPEAVATTE